MKTIRRTTLFSVTLAAACSARTSSPVTAAPEEDAKSPDVSEDADGMGEAEGPTAGGAEDVVFESGPLVAGPFTIHPSYHATTRIVLGDTTIWLDPWSKAPLDDVPPADIVLITDVHFDHLDEEAITKVAHQGSVFVAPKAVADQRAEKGTPVAHVLAHGESVSIEGLSIEAVPMYNLTRGPEEGGLFHEPGRGNGYILSSGDTRVYFAGDTACIPEMKALTDIDAAFVPMNLPYTMTPEEAATCVEAFRPSVVVPYHFAGSDLSVFRDALAGVDGVEVRLLQYYPGGLPW